MANHKEPDVIGGAITTWRDPDVAKGIAAQNQADDPDATYEVIPTHCGRWAIEVTDDDGLLGYL